ncbi:ankyrin repeat-containing domain protein [Aspergillus avenaceus]|uniref:Ankyrin repeat-containing domain protein n=1 Tax=Aspergillus avenaceus TaxID=36643 RepID=A0A5N6TRW8_ASPAV|nr:ankyrin repeat-containing domain protein [Aspergillus avenaceus]
MDSCQTAGNGDLYGLGVRIGLYLQCAAGFLLRNFNGSWKTISTVRVTNNAICYSVILTLIIQYAQGAALSTDFLLVYYLTIALFYSESYKLLEKRDASHKNDRYILRPDMPLILQNLLFALASFLGGWFWISGVNRAQPPTCTAKAACLGVFDLESLTWRRFAATVSIVAGLIFLIYFVVHMVAILAGRDQGPVTRTVTKLGVSMARTFMMGSGAWDTRHYPYRYKLQVSGKRSPISLVPQIFYRMFPDLTFTAGVQWTVINLLGPAIAIVSVERMLVANHIDTDGISESSGQIMALLTGIGSMCMALTDLMKGAWDKRPDVAEDLLSSYAYCSPAPLGHARTKSAAIQFIHTQSERDPAFLEDLIQIPGEGHSTLMTDSVRAPNRNITILSHHDPEAEKPSKKIKQRFLAAAKAGRVGDVQTLLKQGVDPNSTDEYGRAPLHWASANGNKALTEVLLKTDQIDVDCKDDFERTPLWWAVANGHGEIVQMLLGTDGPDINCRDLKCGRSPLSCAAWKGDESLVGMLLAQNEIDPDCYNMYGRTPLSEAAGNGHATATQLLLNDRRVDPNYPDRDGRTPLSWAAMNGYEPVVRMLLALDKVARNHQDQFRHTPLSLAAKGGYEGIVRLLLESEVSRNPEDPYSRTPLCWAAMNGHVSVAKLLLARGANPQSADRYSRTPLCWAALRGHHAVVDLLLGSSKDQLSLRDIHNRVPLAWATQNGHADVVELLDFEGHDRMRDCEGQTPLSIAICNGDARISYMLLGPYKDQPMRPDFYI